MDLINSEWAMKVGDVISLSALLGYFIGVIPVIATLLTIVWTAIRIYETDTVQKWVKRKHNQL